MTKPNSFAKNLKNINTLINNLLERNLNKLKFNNFKILASNNKFIFSFVALFTLFISYLLIPTFYKQVDISRELREELLTKFNLDFNFTQKLNYSFFPRPHFTTEGSSINENQKNISEIAKLKLYLSLENFFSIKNVNINNVKLENANFKLTSKNYNFFLKILNNNFLNTNFKIKNSKIFFRNSNNEVLFINKIKNLEYYYDTKELQNVLFTQNEIFNFPYSLKIINYFDEKKLYSELNANSANLRTENMYNYKDDIKLGAATIILDKKKSKVDYKIESNYFEFDYYDSLDKKKFLYNGKFNFKPFYSSLDGNAEEISILHFFGFNALIPQLIKTEIFNNKNLEFKFQLNAKKIRNNKNFSNFILKSKIFDGLIDIDESRIEWKNSIIAKLNDTLIYVKDGKLVLSGRTEINISNVKNIYQYLATPKNFRKKIKKINFNFSYIFDEKTLLLKDIMIDGKYNKKVNEKLNNIYLRDDDLQNKIYFKNLMNSSIKAYVG